MIDQQVIVPLVSHEMAMTEFACTKAQYNGKTNSSLMVCRGSPNFIGTTNMWHGGHYLRRWKSVADWQFWFLPSSSPDLQIRPIQKRFLKKASLFVCSRFVYTELCYA